MPKIIIFNWCAINIHELNVGQSAECLFSKLLLSFGNQQTCPSESSVNCSELIEKLISDDSPHHACAEYAVRHCWSHIQKQPIMGNKTVSLHGPTNQENPTIYSPIHQQGKAIYIREQILGTKKIIIIILTKIDLVLQSALWYYQTIVTKSYIYIYIYQSQITLNVSYIST